MLLYTCVKENINTNKENINSLNHRCHVQSHGRKRVMGENYNERGTINENFRYRKDHGNSGHERRRG